MFLDPEVAGRIELAGINVRESFTITRIPAGENGGPPTFNIARIVGEQPNGTLVLHGMETATPKLPAGDNAIPRKPPGSALVSEANGLVDAYAEVLDRALTTYQGRVKPEEVRALLISRTFSAASFRASPDSGGREGPWNLMAAPPSESPRPRFIQRKKENLTHHAYGATTARIPRLGHSRSQAATPSPRLGAQGTAAR